MGQNHGYILYTGAHYTWQNTVICCIIWIISLEDFLTVWILLIALSVNMFLCSYLQMVVFFFWDLILFRFDVLASYIFELKNYSIQEQHSFGDNRILHKQNSEFNGSCNWHFQVISWIQALYDKIMYCFFSPFLLDSGLVWVLASFSNILSGSSP